MNLFAVRCHYKPSAAFGIDRNFRIYVCHLSLFERQKSYYIECLKFRMNATTCRMAINLRCATSNFYRIHTNLSSKAFGMAATLATIFFSFSFRRPLRLEL